MVKKRMAAMLAALAITGAWAGPPGENTNGSTTITLQTTASGDDSCVVSDADAALALDSDSGPNAQADAFAAASSMAEGGLAVGWSGDVTFDITRHGKNGSVFQINLDGSVGAGQLYAMTSMANAATSVGVSAETEEEASAFAQAVATALVQLGFQIGWPDIATISLTGSTTGHGEAMASSGATAFATTESYSSGYAGAQASVWGANGMGANGNVYVQGAHIEEFQAGIGLAGASVVAVDTHALAQSVAQAYAMTAVMAIAEARAEALADMRVDFCYDVVLVGSDCLNVLDFQASANHVANQINQNQAQISAFAEAYAESYGSLLAFSTVGMNAVAMFENLNGTEDLISLVGTPQAQLFCGTADAGASASADAEVN